jgi:hypothetical protein
LGGAINASDDLWNSVVLRPEDGVHELPHFAIASDKRGPKRELSTVRWYRLPAHLSHPLDPATDFKRYPIPANLAAHLVGRYDPCQPEVRVMDRRAFADRL